MDKPGRVFFTQRVTKERLEFCAAAEMCAIEQVTFKRVIQCAGDVAGNGIYRLFQAIEPALGTRVAPRALLSFERERAEWREERRNTEFLTLPSLSRSRANADTLP